MELQLLDLLLRLVSRDAVRTEAEVQADIRQLLLSAPFNLADGDVRVVLMESPVGDRRRIDVELGSAVIEVKRDLRRGRVKSEAVEQLTGYVETRAAQTGRRYVGILTDGAEWNCYDLRGSDLVEVTTLTVGPGQAEFERLLIWIEGILATAQGVTPNVTEIEARLGARSSSHQLDSATIAELYRANSHMPSIRMKRGLWSKLLTSTLGTQFEDTDSLFVEHTLLVNSAEIIAHAVLGLNLEHVGPNGLLSGEIFEQSGIYGVVEEDFFDWVLEVQGGSVFVRSLAQRLARFDWSRVDQDVMKVLYESVIGVDTRRRLGEYYTPDWLAAMVVEQLVDTPLDRRVLDPACGSGTFLFHAVRHYLAAAEHTNMSIPDRLRGVTRSVFGMDLHPVAVTFARVTYLLAIGRDLLLNPARGPISIPVYLGDSVQWNDQATNLWNAGNLVVPIEDRTELFASELRFPDRLLVDATMFDDLVEGMADLASRRTAGARVPSLAPLFQRLAVPQEARQVIEATFRTMCSLHDQGRNHIWSYYVRNIARPMWMSRVGNRVDILIGNPPWLAFRHMPEEMQDTFKGMSEARHLWAGAENATHQDLSALFVARATQLYLREGGRFGMVLPNAVVDRDHYAGFRAGDFDEPYSQTRVAFSPSWDLRRIRPHFFPRGSSVVFGQRVIDPVTMPLDVEIFSGRIPRGSTSRAAVEPCLERRPGRVTISNGVGSPYRTRFRQGAILSPRLCFFVERRPTGPLGAVAGRVPIVSSRSVNEKVPWIKQASIQGVVESRFLRPMYSGETLLPYRTSTPILAVIPQDARHLLRTNDEIAVFPGLAEWWRRCEELWTAHRRTERLSLFEQLDYMSKLSAQFPTPPLRVVYNTAGMHVSAAKLEDPQGIVNSNLYWCAAASAEEADYLCAILNSPVTTEFVRPLMSYGKDERHVHKHVWKLPIPEYDERSTALRRLAELGRTASDVAAGVEVDAELHFAASRRRIRAVIAATEAAREIDELVYEILS